MSFPDEKWGWTEHHLQGVSIVCAYFYQLGVSYKMEELTKKSQIGLRNQTVFFC